MVVEESAESSSTEESSKKVSKITFLGNLFHAFAAWNPVCPKQGEI